MELSMESLILVFFAPAFGVCMLLELRYLRRKGQADYSPREVLCNLALAALHQSADLLATFLLMPFFLWLHQYRVCDITLSPLTVLAAFLLQDFLYYWFHRASHRINWLWASHVAHHSSPRMNFSTTFRQSLTYPISGMWLFWTPLIFVGFPPRLIIAVVAINLGFQFFVHTRVVKRLGWLEYVLNTPSHHRVHHAINPDYIDRNYAGVLIIWDRMFGTFTPERDGIMIGYGITEPVAPWEPLTVTFHRWKKMLSNVFTSEDASLSQRLWYIVGPPDYRDIKERKGK
ncbi:sterol desaturase family protein [Vibrio chagasii]|uniref:sterol desaturase family protein n=1 Tax=Vibrio chagasii TaxID=170679 RepID=UPI00354EF941